MGREAPERGKLPPDQAIEVRREGERVNKLIPEAAPCKESSGSFTRA